MYFTIDNPDFPREIKKCSQPVGNIFHTCLKTFPKTFASILHLVQYCCHTSAKAAKLGRLKSARGDAHSPAVKLRHLTGVRSILHHLVTNNTWGVTNPFLSHSSKGKTFFASKHPDGFCLFCNKRFFFIAKRRNCDFLVDFEKLTAIFLTPY